MDFVIQAWKLVQLFKIDTMKRFTHLAFTNCGKLSNWHLVNCLRAKSSRNVMDGLVQAGPVHKGHQLLRKKKSTPRMSKIKSYKAIVLIRTPYMTV